MNDGAMTRQQASDPLIRRPKDEDGPAALTHAASIVTFVGSLVLAVSSLLVGPLGDLLLMFAAGGVVVSWFLALIASGNSRRSRTTLMVITPLAIAAAATLLVVWNK